MNIYVSTSNKGIHIIQAFQYLFNKYWDVTQSVTILGWDNKPDFDLAPNFQFISLGVDTGPKIGGALIDFFSGIEDEHFIYTVDSHLIIRSVDLRLLRYLARIIENSDCVGRITLTGGAEITEPYNYTVVSEKADFNLVEQSQIANYRMSAVWSIYAKGYFLKYLEPDMDLWKWETEGSERAKMDGWQLLATTGRYPITTCRIYKRGQLHSGSFKSWDKFGEEMAREDQVAVRRIVRGPMWQVAGQSVMLKARMCS